MSDRRTMKHWVIKVNGSTTIDVGPGESVEIGRRPIRPVADNGHRRLEINDKTRSVSKRHALFTVAQNGGASVTDLNSTNGSYVVSGKGLSRLKPDQDFIFPDSPMRLQFGDIPVDFVRIEAEENGDADQQVPDLFNYASSGVNNPDVEPHMASMSVDDILNLRAGEPTTAFSASDVATRLQRAASSLENEGDGPSEGVSSQSADNDAALNEEKVAADDAVSERRSDSETADQHGTRPVDRISLNVMGPEAQTADVKTRDLFKDAMENDLGHQGVQAVDAVQEQRVSQSSETAKPVVAEKMVVDLPSQPDPAKQDPLVAPRRDDAQAQVAEDEQKVSPFSRSEADEVLFVSMAANSMSDAQQGNERNTVSTAQASTGATVESNAEHNKFMRPATSGANGTVSDQVVGTAEMEPFKSTFEPGSVFEKVSNGEFQQKAPEIEVEGMSSDEAKRTTDFAKQFEMAKHPQLLPFLAMNPSLYGDLYEWLSAVGNDDVDAALANNSGYGEYRNKAAGGREQQ